MIIEVLSEDKSSVPLLSQIITELLFDYKNLVPKINLVPHRGKGKLPENLRKKPKKFASTLLDLLPAKVRAYNKIYSKQDLILIIVLDSDNDNYNQIYQDIEYVIRTEAPNKYYVIGIPVEETEAWLLGDRVALLKAYPEADIKILDHYKQDSICGTWEFLAQVILGDKAEELIKIGYPAVGTYKFMWADRISQYMKIDNNKSDSFQEFVKRFQMVLNWAVEDRSDLDH